MEGKPGFVSYIATNPEQSFDPDEMDLLCIAVLHDGRVYFFKENELDRLIELLNSLETVIGVNDLFREILEKHGETSFDYIGLQSMVSDSLGERVSLANTARKTLGMERPEIAALPLEWSEGNRGYVYKQLKKDVILLRELYRYISTQGYVHITRPGSLEETIVDVSI